MPAEPHGAMGADIPKPRGHEVRDRMPGKETTRPPSSHRPRHLSGATVPSPGNDAPIARARILRFSGRAHALGADHGCRLSQQQLGFFQALVTESRAEEECGVLAPAAQIEMVLHLRITWEPTILLQQSHIPGQRGLKAEQISKTELSWHAVISLLKTSLL